MARDTGATVVVPLYPLAPQGTAATDVPAMADLISSQIDSTRPRMSVCLSGMRPRRSPGRRRGLRTAREQFVNLPASWLYTVFPDRVPHGGE